MMPGVNAPEAGALMGVPSRPRCESCGGVLVRPSFTYGSPYASADYVCLLCGRPYRWIGDPPRLITVLTPRPPETPEE
jgi:hypothetical protein